MSLDTCVILKKEHLTKNIHIPNTKKKMIQTNYVLRKVVFVCGVGGCTYRGKNVLKIICIL